MEATWRKSSYSSSNGGNCVEVGVWRKSSYSSTNGGNCVEVGSASNQAIVAAVGSALGSASNTAAGTAHGGAPWRKSTHSTGNGGACVETATLGAAVAVRDTKDSGQGPVLHFTPHAWATFTTTLK
jgi:hypothetical protein